MTRARPQCFRNKRGCIRNSSLPFEIGKSARRIQNLRLHSHMAKSRLLDILKVFSRLHLSPDARRVTTHRARTPPDRGTPRHASFPPLARRSANALALVTRLRARSRLRARLGLPKSRIGQVEKKREAHTSPRLRRSDDRLVFPGGRPACRVRGVACPRQRARSRLQAPRGAPRPPPPRADFGSRRVLG